MSLKQDVMNKALMDIIEGGKEHQEMQMVMGIQKMAQTLQGFGDALEGYKKQYPTYQMMELEKESFPGFVQSLQSVRQMLGQLNETCETLLKDMNADKQVAPPADEGEEDGTEGGDS